MIDTHVPKLRESILIFSYPTFITMVGFFTYLITLNHIDLEFRHSLDLERQLTFIFGDNSLYKVVLVCFLLGIPTIYLPIKYLLRHNPPLYNINGLKIAKIYLPLYIIMGAISYSLLPYNALISKALLIVTTSLLFGFIGGFFSYPYLKNLYFPNYEVTSFAYFIIKKIPLYLFFLAFLLYSLYSLLSHYYFYTTTWDLGLYIQVISRLSEFQTPSTLIGNNPNTLGSHFELYLLPTSLLYRFWQSPYLLLLTQSFVLAVGVFPVYSLTKEILKSSFAAVLVATSYIFFFGIQSAIGFDFHSLVFAVPLLAYALYFLKKRENRKMLLFLILAVLVRENVALYVSFFGLYLMLFDSRKYLGLFITLFSLGYFQILTTYIMPNLSPVGPLHLANNYLQFGMSLPTIIQGIILNPVNVAKTLFTPETKLVSLFLTFASFSFFPLLSLRSLFLISPLFLEKYLGSVPVVWGLGFHYSANLAPYLIFGALSGVENITKLKNISIFAKDFNQTCLKVSLCLCLLVSSIFFSVWGYFYPFPPWNLSQRVWVTEEKKIDTANNYEALKLIPHNASVYSQNHLVPHLANREEIELLTNRYNNKYDFILIDLAFPAFPITEEEQRKITREYLDSPEYDLIFSKGTTLVFRKGIEHNVPLSSQATKLLKNK